MYGLGYFSERRAFKRSARRLAKERAEERRYKTRLIEARTRARIQAEKSELFNLEHPHLARIGKSIHGHAKRQAKKTFGSWI